MKSTNQYGIPVIGFAAYSGVGKTTLIESLIRIIKKKGFKVAVIKHDGHEFEIDHEGKDSWRFTHAGADITMIGSARQVAYIEQRELSLDQMLAMIQNVDLILVEGYKNADIPQIGIARQASGKGFTAEVSRFMALVTDMPIETDKPCFGFRDEEAITEFIIEQAKKTARY